MGLFENSHFPYTNFHEMNMDKLVETVEEAAGQAGQMADRMGAAERDIDTLETRADTTDVRIASINSNIDSVESDIDALETRATTSEGNITALTTRVTTAEGDIDALDTRLTTDEATIATQATQIAGKSTVGVDQLLAGGVRVADITVDGSTTTLYAPTAGSTYVRAEDVPFNNSDVTPAMTATDCQAAIEELNTDIGSLDAGDIAFTPTQIFPQADTVEIALNNANDRFVRIFAALNKLEWLDHYESYFDWYNDDPTENHTYTWGLGTLVAAGYVSGSGSNLLFMIPHVRSWAHGTGMDPTVTPQSWNFELSGLITVRGVNGYVPSMNNVNVLTLSPTITFTNAGIMVQITLPTASSSDNNKPCNVYMSNAQIVANWIAPTT